MHIGILATSNILVCIISVYLYTKFALEDFKLGQKTKEISHDKIDMFHTMHWCFDHQSRICRFQSLCYYPFEDQFVYLVNNSSQEELKSTLLSLSFSSVSELDAFSFAPVFISQNFSKLKIHWLGGNVMLFKRFKPDNIMHVLHDDVLPLYHTLQFLGERKLKLLFMDNFTQGPYDIFYKLLADVRYKPSANEQELVCFESAFIGVSPVSKWYQYGYHGKVQGPVANDKLNSFHIHGATSSIMKKLKSATNNQYIGDYLVLISRTETRRILNEKKLISKIEFDTKMKILVISDGDFSEMVHVVQASRGIIGMHGALLILGLFLKPGSILIELFPYAVNPDNYTPYRTLSSIPGMSIIYNSWRNKEKTKSFFHPDYPPEEGGIRHLPEKIQAQIMEQEEVPLHSCCSDPAWLFYINQDTEVNVEEVVHIIQKALTESNLFTGPQVSDKEPSVVKHLQCSCADNKLTLNWEKPWNLDYIGIDSVQYMIGVQSRQLKSYKVYIVNVISYVIEDGIDCNDTYNVWVNAEMNGVKGVVQYIEC